LDAEGKVAFRIYDGSDNLNLSEFVNQFFRAQKISISKVFSTSYSTFFIDEYGQIHSFGLNDRGQMGFNNLGVIKKPQRINLPFKTDLTSSRT
jgi:alpha-tubulin suppressor-like RCC1 family protein